MTEQIKLLFIKLQIQGETSVVPKNCRYSMNVYWIEKMVCDDLNIVYDLGRSGIASVKGI